MISQKKKKIHIIGTNARDIDDCTLEAIEKIDSSDLIILSRVFSNNFFLHAKQRRIRIIEQESLSKVNNPSLWEKINKLFDSQNRVITHLLDGDTYVDHNGLEEKNFFNNNGIDCQLTPGMIKFVNILNRNSELLTVREKNSSVTFIKSFEVKEVGKILENSYFEKAVIILESKAQFNGVWGYLRKRQSVANFKIRYIDGNFEDINKLTINKENMLKIPAYIIIEKNE